MRPLNGLSLRLLSILSDVACAPAFGGERRRIRKTGGPSAGLSKIGAEEAQALDKARNGNRSPLQGVDADLRPTPCWPGMGCLILGAFPRWTREERLASAPPLHAWPSTRIPTAHESDDGQTSPYFQRSPFPLSVAQGGAAPTPRPENPLQAAENAQNRPGNCAATASALRLRGSTPRSMIIPPAAAVGTSCGVAPRRAKRAPGRRRRQAQFL